MIKKVVSSDLQAGMYVVDTGIDWRKNPYIYSKEQFLAPDDIKKLQAEGYLEAFIDEEKSLKIKGPDDWAAITLTPKSLVARVSLQEEFPVAMETYTACIDKAKIFLDGVRQGKKINCDNAEALVAEIIDSVGRNPDALIGLSKLRTTDDYTYSHCVNVSIMATMFARYLGFSEAIQHAVGMSGMFHDVGKAAIPLEILNAPRKLNDDEFQVMRNHPVLGYEELRKGSGFTDEMLHGIVQHHERYNGTGYPYRMSGDDISVTARILSITDIYDALTSKRVYKSAMPSHQVLAMMYKMRGEDFYPGYAEHYTRLIGIYPVGSVVLLKDGSRGVVSASNPEKPTKPRVKIVENATGQSTPSQEWDIAKGECAEIERCLLKSETGIEPTKTLGIPVVAI